MTKYCHYYLYYYYYYFRSLGSVFFLVRPPTRPRSPIAYAKTPGKRNARKTHVTPSRTRPCGSGSVFYYYYSFFYFVVLSCSTVRIVPAVTRKNHTGIHYSLPFSKGALKFVCMLYLFIFIFYCSTCTQRSFKSGAHDLIVHCASIEHIL